MTSQKNLLTFVICFLAWICFAPAASAEPYETIVNNGRADNRVDIVILGDGYTAAEMAIYKADAQNFINALFNEEPFKEYRRYFNVHRAVFLSADSQSRCRHSLTVERSGVAARSWV